MASAVCCDNVGGGRTVEEVQGSIAHNETKVLATGRFLGTIAGNWAEAQERYVGGYQLLMLMTDGVSLPIRLPMR